MVIICTAALSPVSSIWLFHQNLKLSSSKYRIFQIFNANISLPEHFNITLPLLPLRRLLGITYHISLQEFFYCIIHIIFLSIILKQKPITSQVDFIKGFILRYKYAWKTSFCTSGDRQLILDDHSSLTDKNFSSNFDKMSLYLIYPYKLIISLYCWKVTNPQSYIFFNFFPSTYRHRGFRRQVVNVTEMMREEPTSLSASPSHMRWFFG